MIEHCNERTNTKIKLTFRYEKLLFYYEQVEIRARRTR